MKNILLFDLDSIFRSNIRALIESNSQWRMVGDAPDLRDIKGYLGGQYIDIIMVGVDLAPKQREELGLWLKTISFTTKIILIVETKEDGSFRMPFFVDGIDGYLLKNIGGQELFLCLQLVSGGGRYLSSGLYSLLMEARLAQKSVRETFINQDSTFSYQEVQLLQLAVKGMSLSAIGKKLSMSADAVRKHFELFFERTGTNSYSSLIKFAFESGIVP